MHFFALLEALRPYQHLDPEHWVQLGGFLPAGGLVLMVILGGYLLVASNTRPAAAVLGLVAGLVWVGHVFNEFGLYTHERAISVVAGLGLGLVGFAVPPVVAFAVWGIPAGLLVGGWVGPMDFAAGFVPAALLAGVAAALIYRGALTVAAALLGGWMAALGLASLLGVRPAADAPHAAVLPLFEAAGVAALASVAAHGTWASFRGQWLARRAGALARRLRAQEKKALEQRWGKQPRD